MGGADMRSLDFEMKHAFVILQFFLQITITCELQILLISIIFILFESCHVDGDCCHSDDNLYFSFGTSMCYILSPIKCKNEIHVLHLVRVLQSNARMRSTASLVSGHCSLASFPVHLVGYSGRFLQFFFEG